MFTSLICRKARQYFAHFLYPQACGKDISARPSQPQVIVHSLYFAERPTPALRGLFSL